MSVQRNNLTEYTRYQDFLSQIQKMCEMGSTSYRWGDPRCLGIDSKDCNSPFGNDANTNDENPF